jgi:hypothetical protein
MIHINKLVTGCLTTAAVVMAGLMTAPAAQAQREDIAAMAAYNNNYLETSGGNTYYTGSLKSAGTSPSGEWVEAVEIYVAEDRYEYTRAAADRNTVIALLNSLEAQNPTWQSDGWDDNLAWMAVAFMRGYKLTGQAMYLTQAEGGFNTAWTNGWTTNLGGGILEKQDGMVKCALSNNPFIIEGVDLYQATGDTTYLTKAEEIYAWVRSNLYIQSTGQENGCENGDGTLQVSDLVYNSGTFVDAANALYRVTGTATYYNEAFNATNHVVNGTPILNSTDNTSGNEWEYWFTRGLNHFATDNNLWPTYQGWLQNNANASWNERNNLNLTWNDWTNPTTNNLNVDAMVMASGAAVWQHLPAPAQNLSGTWEIQNVKSGLALTIAGGVNTTGAAIVQEPYTSGPHELWKFVPTSGGYYQIVNNVSGLDINVSGNNAQNGINGALLIQWTPQGMNPGNDQWAPFQNADGTWSFYSLNSLQALEVPGNSTTAGTQLDQWFSNGGTNQEFKLIAH